MFNDDGSINEDELREKLRELMAEDQIEEQIALLEIEARLAQGDTVWAASQLRCFRREVPRWDGRPDLFDMLIEEDPLAAGKVLETRALVYRDAGLLPEAQKDFVRSLLVAGDELSAGRVLSVFADLEGVELEPWMRKALSAVTARFRGDAPAEKQALLEAIRGAPRELFLFAALVRNQEGSGSEVELFALRQAVRLAPLWGDARLELMTVAELRGEPEAAEVEELPDRDDDELEERDEDRDVA